MFDHTEGFEDRPAVAVVNCLERGLCIAGSRCGFARGFVYSFKDLVARCVLDPDCFVVGEDRQVGIVEGHCDRVSLWIISIQHAELV